MNSCFKVNFDKSFLEPAKGIIKVDPKVDKSSSKPTNITIKHEPKVDKSSSKPTNITIKHEPKIDKAFSKPANSSSTVKHVPILSIPNCRVHLVGSKEAVEIANGDFSAVNLQLVESGRTMATVIKVGKDLQWPLTKDEPVVKLNSCDYLFSLPMRGGHESLSYGVSFVGKPGGMDLGKLDKFLAENSCFSISDSSGEMKGVVNWKDYAPKVDEYNNSLAKAIANGTGKLVQGIFKCSEAYTRQIQKASELIMAQPVPEKKKKKMGGGGAALLVTLKRVRDVSKFVEEISKGVAEGMGIAIGSVLSPVMQSEQGKNLLSKVPGDILLVSLDAVNRLMEAAEMATKLSRTATSASATKILTQRYGGDVGEAAEDVFATAENCINTAWNIFKMRKAIKPTSAAGRGMLLKNALRTITIKK